MAIKFFAFFFPTISTFGCFWSQWPTSLAVTSGCPTMRCGRLPSRSNVNMSIAKTDEEILYIWVWMSQPHRHHIAVNLPSHPQALPHNPGPNNTRRPVRRIHHHPYLWRPSLWSANKKWPLCPAPGVDQSQEPAQDLQPQPHHHHNNHNNSNNNNNNHHHNNNNNHHHHHNNHNRTSTSILSVTNYH